jgi:hypothetical protein
LSRFQLRFTLAEEHGDVRLAYRIWGASLDVFLLLSPALPVGLEIRRPREQLLSHAELTSSTLGLFVVHGLT